MLHCSVIASADLPVRRAWDRDTKPTMSNLAYRIDDCEPTAPRPGVAPWAPPAAPLEMPRQSLRLDRRDPASPAPRLPATSPVHVMRRRAIVFSLTFLLAGLALIAPTVMSAREGFQPLELVALGLFGVLILAIACWFTSAAAGLFVLMTGRDQDDLDFAPNPSTPSTRTALLMPLYNEDPDAAMARLAQLDASLARLGVSDAFDLVILSDTNKAECFGPERAAFQALRAQAHSRAYYRRRDENHEQKAGNLGEWVRNCGAAYDFMLVLDADSTMAGETVLRMVDAMERNTGVGLIQTAPRIVKARTLYARVSQFSVRMYGQVAAAGLAWWTGSEGSYWGHNAIVRVKAFAEAAGLPVLPGRKPFGGNVMSHDVVEAALLRRAGWAVHVTAALEGSFEETPPTLTDFIRRDHRWCQGNMQHLSLIRAHGLNPWSRLQMGMGFMAYASSFLWLSALVVGLALELQNPVDWGSFFYILNPQFTPFMAASLFCGLLLIGPKLMGAALVISRPRERRAFGGVKRIARGVAAEIAMSAVMAPILMIANTRAIVKILLGHDAGWHAQQRDADGLSWKDALRAMRWQTLAGLAFVAALTFRPDLATWFAPIVLPLLLSAPLAVWTSRRSAGDAFARAGLLVTPEQDGVTVSPAVFRPLPAFVEAVLPPAEAAPDLRRA